ncbi:hypothetical protein JCM8202_005840, partial [Rhodotorula sphaerocarpa]
MGIKGFMPTHLKRDANGIATSTHHGLEEALREVAAERQD